MTDVSAGAASLFTLLIGAVTSLHHAFCFQEVLSKGLVFTPLNPGLLALWGLRQVDGTKLSRPFPRFNYPTELPLSPL